MKAGTRGGWVRFGIAAAVTVGSLLLLQPSRPGARSGAPAVWRGPSWSSVREAVYDPATRVLRVGMADGAAYECRGVPARCFAEFLRASGKGLYFHREIRSRYTVRRLELATGEASQGPASRGDGRPQ